MNILITGKSGYLSRNLAPLLLDNHINLYFVTRETGIAMYNSNIGNIYYYKSNFPKFEDLLDFFSDIVIDKVIHLSSFTPDMNDTDYKKILEINLMFTIELIKFSNAKKIEEFIGFGSYVEFDRNVSNQPDSYSFYALTKIFQRKITKFFSKEFRVPVTYLTLNHVYGGDEKKRIISKLINSFLTGNTINLDYGLRKIDYVNILDVLDAILIIVMKKNDSNLNNWKFLEYGIGTKKFYNLRELVDLFKSEFNVHLPVIFDEINTNTDKPDYVWQDYTYPPSWSPKITLIDGLRRLIENKDNDEYK